MAEAASPRRIFRIEASEPSGSVVMSPLDKRDKFFHMSGDDLLAGTLGRYFKDVPEVYILELKANETVVRPTVKFEEVGHGAFPHAYGLETLPLDSFKATKLTQKEGGWEAPVAELLATEQP